VDEQLLEWSKLSTDRQLDRGYDYRECYKSRGDLGQDIKRTEIVFHADS